MKSSKPREETSVFAASGPQNLSQAAFGLSSFADGNTGSRRLANGCHDYDNKMDLRTVRFNKSQARNRASRSEEEPDDYQQQGARSPPIDDGYDQNGTEESCEKNGITLHLMNAPLWRQFSDIGTEMIITKKGRRVFPVPSFMIEDLLPNSLYNITLTVLPVDDMVHRFINNCWVPHKDGSGGFGMSSTSERSSYLHPSSPNTGAFWTADPIIFGGLKISNNGGSHGTILLQSMRKYRMTIVVSELGSSTETSFPQELTDFVAVTQYQNELVTKMKIEHNPFANAFRFPNKSKGDKKENASADQEDESDSHRMASFVPILPRIPSAMRPSFIPIHSPYQHSMFSQHPALAHNKHELSFPPRNHEDYSVMNPNYPSHILPPELWPWAQHPDIDFPTSQSESRINGNDLSDGKWLHVGSSLMNASADVSPQRCPIPTAIHRNLHSAASRLGQLAVNHTSSHGSPLSEVRQLSEYVKREANQAKAVEAIPLLRKRRLHFDLAHDEESVVHISQHSPSKKMATQHSPSPTKSMMPGLVRGADFGNVNNEGRSAKGQRPRLGSRIPDAFPNGGLNRSPDRDDVFAQESVWAGELDEDLPTDMTVTRRSAPQDSPGPSEASRHKVKKPLVSLKNRDVWCTTNEVVVNAQGRPMFPYVSLDVAGLEARRLYYVGLELTAASRWLHNYTGHEWRPCLASTLESKVVLHQHPTSPKYGHEWGDGVVFDDLKLSTARQGTDMLKVQLRRQYNPVIVIRTEGHKWTYPLKEASFITVSIDKTPLVYLQRGLPEGSQDFESGVDSSCRSAQRKQKNPRKMESSSVVPYAMAMSVYDNLANGVAGPFDPPEGTTPFTYASGAIQPHGASLNGEDIHIYGVDQSSPPGFMTSDPDLVSGSPGLEHRRSFPSVHAHPESNKKYARQTIGVAHEDI